jgi:predicted secreted protein
MRAWISAAALCLCLPAPALAETVIETTPLIVALEGNVSVTADMNGQTIAARQGGKVIVSLQFNPSTGARWVVAEQPDFLDAPTTTTVAPPQTNPPRLGAPRTANLSFLVTGASSGDIVLEKRGPGAQNALLETFRVTISAE